MICTPPSNIIRVIKLRRMRLEWNVAHMVERRRTHRILIGRPEGRRTLGRPRRHWEDNIKIDLQEVGRDYGLNDMAQVTDSWRVLINAIMNY